MTRILSSLAHHSKGSIPFHPYRSSGQARALQTCWGPPSMAWACGHVPGRLARTPVVEHEEGRQGLIRRVEDDLRPTHTPLLKNASCMCGLLYDTLRQQTRIQLYPMHTAA